MSENNPYNNQGQQPMMPPPPMPVRPMPRQRVIKTTLLTNPNARPLTMQQERTLPNWIIGSSVIAFIIAFAACTLAFGYPMELRYVIVSLLSVLLFFYGSRAAVNGSVREGEKAFVKNVFIVGTVARLLWVIYCYFFFNPECYGNTYGDDADTGWYMNFANNVAEWLKGESEFTFGQMIDINTFSIDDTGYPIWLGIGYAIWGDWSDVFIPLLIKCVVGAYCGICIYHIAKRHFGVGVARMAALFVALNPNMIYWCGTMYKEAEMMFLCCLSVDFVDRTFTSGSKLTFKSLLPGILVGSYLFFFRSALAIVIFLAMGAHIVMASHRVMSAGKKIIAGVMVGIVLLVGMGDRLRSQAEDIVETVQSDDQDTNMKWRSERKGGNEFAKYAGKAVFAPLIFTIPFPTFNMANTEQILQAQLSGGNYIKNILSFFVILVMFLMLISGEWRKHVFILAYTLGYLMTLVLSNFAQSSRFHMPIWPFLMLFAAYGIQVVKSKPRIRRWWPMVLVVEVIICLGWNWFKLKGRGMI